MYAHKQIRWKQSKATYWLLYKLYSYITCSSVVNKVARWQWCNVPCQGIVQMQWLIDYFLACLATGNGSLPFSCTFSPGHPPLGDQFASQELWLRLMRCCKITKCHKNGPDKMCEGWKKWQYSTWMCKLPLQGLRVMLSCCYAFARLANMTHCLWRLVSSLIYIRTWHMYMCNCTIAI